MRFNALALILTFTLALPALAEDGQIDIAQLPTTITQPGSYVVVDNLTLTATDTNGITIANNVDNVTIDLAGHVLRGPGGTAGTTGHGIHAGGSENVTVLNGCITGFRGSGIEFYGTSNRVIDVTCSDNGMKGIWVGVTSLVSHCISRDNGDNGISAGSCSVVQGNILRDNAGDGISAWNSTLADNSCYSNDGDGIQGTECLVSGNTCVDNVGLNLNLTTSTSVGNHAP